jgi:hypothetical protein
MQLTWAAEPIISPSEANQGRSQSVTDPRATTGLNQLLKALMIACIYLKEGSAVHGHSAPVLMIWNIFLSSLPYTAKTR